MADPAMQQVYGWHKGEGRIHEVLELVPCPTPAPSHAPPAVARRGDEQRQQGQAVTRIRTNAELAADLGAALPSLTTTTVLFIYNLVAFLCNTRRFGELLEAADPHGVVRGLTMDIPTDVAEQKQPRLGGAGEPIEVKLAA